MQMFSGILLAAVLFTLVAIGAQWWRTTEDLDASRRTVEGYLTLIEGLYAFRAENVSRWPTSFTPLTTHLPNLQVDSVDPTKAGANGEGGRFEMAIAGSRLTLTTVVTAETHAQAVIREFGANGTYGAVADGYEIEVAVPVPGGIALMQQTLLTDGTNKMQRPLWLQNTLTVGSSCTGNGLGVDGSGNLMRCDGGVWQTH